ncbi:MAG: DUF1015 domain-containing protein [Clostridia bacterium]
MNIFSKYGLKKAHILLPDARVDASKWAVVACDQFTSEPEYWQAAEELVGDAPSTLRLVYPECYLAAGKVDAEVVHAQMREYEKSVLTRSVDGFILVERQTSCGPRLGLMVEIDLEQYDFAPGVKPLIRSTEGTVAERLPPRMALRRGASLELPHVMLLADDAKKTLIEPLYARREALRPVYDVELMLGGGRLRGWAVEDAQSLEGIARALEGLYAGADGFLFAVGDGNHSLAAARGCWLEVKKNLRPEETFNHPARYALVELVNLYDPALVFEPIHRAVFGADGAQLTLDFILYCRAQGMSVTPCQAGAPAQLYLLDKPLRIENAKSPLPVAIVQRFLDDWLPAHPGAKLDYIHGLDALSNLNAVRIQLTAMDKAELFPAVRRAGALPRKTFSMGEARDKRYYFEARRIAPEGK